jgi:hypothetical protein
MTYCKNCGSEITETDREAGYCTQCKTPLVAPEPPLEHKLLMSIREVQSERDAEEVA